MRSEQKKCLACNRVLKGRADKKFCDDYCRSVINNRKYIAERGLIRRVNHVLLKNRRILEHLLNNTHGKVTILRKTLSARGFQFDFFTHTHHTADGKKYFCCYDLAYTELFNEELFISRLSAKTDIMLIPYTEYEQE